MNQNNLTNVTALRIAQIISEPNTKIKEIGLKWNKFNAVAGNRFAEVLCDNTHLKVLDLSWNSIGVRPKDTIDPKNPRGKPAYTMKVGDIGRVWGLMFISNKTLVHLDISFNKIDEEETILISQDLVTN